MANSDDYRKALQAVADGLIPLYGDDVIRMIADKHAEVEYRKAQNCLCGKHPTPERYIIRLTDAGKATLRALSISE